MTLNTVPQDPQQSKNLGCDWDGEGALGGRGAPAERQALFVRDHEMTSGVLYSQTIDKYFAHIRLFSLLYVRLVFRKPRRRFL